MLGRTVATFGFLENVLARAIFVFTGTKEYSEDELQAALEAWLPKLERSLTDTLHPLVNTYAKAVKEHNHAPPDGFEALISDLRNAAELRNVLCHGAWMKAPDTNGATIPFFVRAKDNHYFNDPVDISYLERTQRAVSRLAVAVVDTVTFMGYQFPGSSGPGRPLA